MASFFIEQRGNHVKREPLRILADPEYYQIISRFLNKQKLLDMPYVLAIFIRQLPMWQLLLMMNTMLKLLMPFGMTLSDGSFILQVGLGHKKKLKVLVNLPTA